MIEELGMYQTSEPYIYMLPPFGPNLTPLRNTNPNFLLLIISDFTEKIFLPHFENENQPLLSTFLKKSIFTYNKNEYLYL